MTQSGGFIALDSEHGVGTTFELILPHVAVPTPAAQPTCAPARRGGSKRILLVEDEAVVRNLTRAMLLHEGYDVTTAANAAQALTLSREQTFDLVITDMVMPKMSGNVLAESLRSERPKLPIIVISGYAHDECGGDVGAGDAFLQKPFSAEELSDAVRASLDHFPSLDHSPSLAA